MKKVLSFVLVFIMILSCCAVFTTSADENTTIYFEVPHDWHNVTQIMCYIWEYETQHKNKFANWESKKTYCTDEGNGIWSYDTVAKTGKILEPGKVYAVIFNANTGLQTYDLLLSSACYGDTAYCDGTKFENPADSNKTSIAAYWRGQDKSVYGPIMGITSIGNVVGNVIAPGETASDIFIKFLNDILPNARTYTGKSDQDIIDTIAKDLRLDNNTIDRLIRASGIEVDWVNPDSPVYPSSKLLYGDLDFDGKVTIKDATIIQKYVAGIEVNSPVGSVIPR